MYNRPPRFACRRSLVFDRALFSHWIKKERDRGRKGSEVWLCQLERATVVIPLSRGRILGNPLPFQSTTPKPSPWCTPAPPPLPSHQSKQYSDPLCFAKSSLSLKVDSRWISFSGVKRTRVASRFSLSLALYHPLPPPPPTTDGRPFSFSRQSVGHAAMLNVTVQASMSEVIGFLKCKREKTI